MYTPNTPPNGLPIEVCGVARAEQASVDNGIQVKGRIALDGFRDDFCFVVPDGRIGVLRYAGTQRGAERVEIIGAALSDLNDSYFRHKDLHIGLRVLDVERAHQEALYSKSFIESRLAIGKRQRPLVKELLKAARAKESKIQPLMIELDHAAQEYKQLSDKLEMISFFAARDHLAGIFRSELAER